MNERIYQLIDENAELKAENLRLEAQLVSLVGRYGDNWYDGYLAAWKHQRDSKFGSIDDYTTDDILEMSEAAESEYLKKSWSRNAEQPVNSFIIKQQAKAFENAQIPHRGKAGCIGEFEFTIEDGVCCPECWEEQSNDCQLCNGQSNESGLSDLTATVPWDLCKEIWLRMNKIYAEQLRKEQE